MSNSIKQYPSPENGRHYYTHELYLAAYLYTHGLELISTEMDSSGEPVFVFHDVVGRDELVQAFKYGPLAPVDARLFTLVITELETMVDQVRKGVPV